MRESKVIAVPQSQKKRRASTRTALFLSSGTKENRSLSVRRFCPSPPAPLPTAGEGSQILILILDSRFSIFHRIVSFCSPLLLWGEGSG